MKQTFLTAFVAMTCAMNVMAQPQLSQQNIDEVIQAMTLEEKAQLLVGGAYNSVEDHAVVGSESTPVLGAAGMTQALPRLAIPATVLTDGPAGVRIEPVRKGSDQTYYATAFPVGSCLASTWNEELATRVGEVIGDEMKNELRIVEVEFTQPL